MKEKTSITLSTDVLAGIDKVAGTRYSRSALIERVLRRYLRDRAIRVEQQKDLALLNDAAEKLNLEAADVLDYQAADE
jgi:metal-responsive CopG/Arc/MetJ family transcriptional regulator